MTSQEKFEFQTRAQMKTFNSTILDKIQHSNNLKECQSGLVETIPERDMNDFTDDEFFNHFDEIFEVDFNEDQQRNNLGDMCDVENPESNQIWDVKQIQNYSNRMQAQMRGAQLNRDVFEDQMNDSYESEDNEQIKVEMQTPQKQKKENTEGQAVEKMRLDLDWAPRKQKQSIQN